MISIYWSLSRHLNVVSSNDTEKNMIIQYFINEINRRQRYFYRMINTVLDKIHTKFDTC